MTQRMSGNEEKVSEVLNNAYYQALQQKLRDKLKRETVQDTPTPQMASQPPKGKGVMGASSSSDRSLASGDRATIRQSQWERNEKSGEFELTPSTDVPLLTAVDLYAQRPQVVARGYDIEWGPRVTRFKEWLSQATIQSRSPQFFVSKLGELKVGMLIRVLSVLGIPPEELQGIQRAAIQSAIQENMTLMGDTIYSSELTELLQGGTRKAKRALRLFATTKKQLIIQMKRLGQPDYWSSLRLTEETITQLGRLLAALESERHQLTYQAEFLITQLADPLQRDPALQKKIQRITQTIQRAQQQSNRRHIEWERLKGDKERELVALGRRLIDPDADRGVSS